MRLISRQRHIRKKGQRPESRLTILHNIVKAPVCVESIRPNEHSDETQGCVPNVSLGSVDMGVFDFLWRQPAKRCTVGLCAVNVHQQPRHTHHVSGMFSNEILDSCSMKGFDRFMSVKPRTKEVPLSWTQCRFVLTDMFSNSTPVDEGWVTFQ